MVYSRGELRLINLGDEHPVTLSRWIGPGSGRIATLADPALATYEAIYTSQRWVRTAVDFLARNVAQCRFQVFRRDESDDRIRLRAPDHPYAAVLAAPDPSARPPLTAFRFVAGLVADMVTYGNGYAIKRPDPDPARQLRIARAEAPYTFPDRFEDDPDLRLRYIRPGYGTEWLDLEDVIWVRAWSPLGVAGLSWLEPLRQLLHEEWEAGNYRSQLWARGARMSGWIKRGLDAGEWSDTARERFRQDWQAQYAAMGPDAGGTPILEEGMEFQPQVFSAEQAQFLESREMDREEVAAAMFIPPTMLGMTKGATYSNTQQHHTMLYQDTLGPIFTDLEQELQLQLLPDFEGVDTENVYCEANIQEKLAGSFEEQASAAKSAVGVPWMTPNEMRARFNLPRIDAPAADSIAMPLNMTPVIISGETPPAEEEPPPAPAASWTPELRALAKSTQAELDAYEQRLAEKLARFFRRQRADLEAAFGAGEPLLTAWDADRWNAELADVMLRQTLPIAAGAAVVILDRWAPDDLEWSDDPFIPPLSAYAASAAEGINIVTYQALADAVLAEDPKEAVGALFAQAMAVRADQEARTAATFATNLGQSDAAKACGLRTKTWVVTSANPRPAHARMAGETVGIGDVFSNGMRWPGDQAAGLDHSEYANCSCRCDYAAEQVTEVSA